MLKAARQKEIVALLQGGGVVEVSVLAERFQTSPITVRRDLIELQERGVLARTRGGAIPGNEVYAEGWARYESLLIANLSIRRSGHTTLIHDDAVADACRSMSRQLLVTDHAVCRVHGLLRGRDMHAAGWVFVGGIFRCV